MDRADLKHYPSLKSYIQKGLVMIEQLHELADKHIYLVDVCGGKMWYNDATKQYAWDIDEMAEGYSALNKLAICYGI